MPLRARSLIRRLRLAAALLLLAALLGFCAWLWAAHWRPRLEDFPVQGIDVSDADGPIEWWTAKASGVQFAYIVATTGADTRDLRFPEHWRGAYEAGVKRGAMHLYSLCQLAADQAGNFVSTVARSEDQLPATVVLDFDPACSARPDREVVLGEIGRLLAAIDTHLGKRSVLQVSKAFEAHYGIGEATTRQLWATQPFFPPYYFTRPWTVWRASSFRRIPGVGRPVNWDVMAR